MLVSLPCVRWSVCHVRHGFGKFRGGEVGPWEIDLVNAIARFRHSADFCAS